MRTLNEQLKAVDDYFKNVTEEQFDKDLDNIGIDEYIKYVEGSMEFECDTTDFKKLEETIIQNIDCEDIEYNGKKWIKEDYCILKSVIREKIEERENKLKNTPITDATIAVITSWTNEVDILKELLGE